MSDRSIATQSTVTPAVLRIADPKTLYEQTNRTYETIARRAFELFENDGRPLGRDLDNWLHAEEELLHPVHVNVRESSDTLTVEAEVPGFSADELQVSLEPRRLIITGKKQSSENAKKGKTVYQERCSSEIFRSIELPLEVTASKATATLNNGVLELTLPKVTEAKTSQVAVKAAGAAG